MIKINVLTLFPEAVSAVLNSSILRIAQVKNICQINVVDLKQKVAGKYQSLDDSPYGGGVGMLLKYDLFDELLTNLKNMSENKNLKVFYPSPRGASLDNFLLSKTVTWLNKCVESDKKSINENQVSANIAVICGRYEGIDQRLIDKWVDIEFSVGDFVLSGGEIPAMALVDGIVRLLPGVLGDSHSAVEDSFQNGLLEYPQFTRSSVLSPESVPHVLRSGNHSLIKRWKMRQSILITYCYRPDLIASHTGEGLEDWAQELLNSLKARLVNSPS